jgi:hypothetical protein
MMHIFFLVVRTCVVIVANALGLLTPATIDDKEWERL